jgi:hypothetical protein
VLGNALPPPIEDCSNRLSPSGWIRAAAQMSNALSQHEEHMCLLILLCFSFGY